MNDPDEIAIMGKHPSEVAEALHRAGKQIFVGRKEELEQFKKVPYGKSKINPASLRLRRDASAKIKMIKND